MHPVNHIILIHSYNHGRSYVGLFSMFSQLSKKARYTFIPIEMNLINDVTILKVNNNQLIRFSRRFYRDRFLDNLGFFRHYLLYPILAEDARFINNGQPAFSWPLSAALG